jgi:hypothetical protein
LCGVRMPVEPRLSCFAGNDPSTNLDHLVEA